MSHCQSVRVTGRSSAKLARVIAGLFASNLEQPVRAFAPAFASCNLTVVGLACGFALHPSRRTLAVAEIVNFYGFSNGSRNGRSSVGAPRLCAPPYGQLWMRVIKGQPGAGARVRQKLQAPSIVGRAPMWEGPPERPPIAPQSACPAPGYLLALCARVRPNRSSARISRLDA